MTDGFERWWRWAIRGEWRTEFRARRYNLAVDPTKRNPYIPCAIRPQRRGDINDALPW